MTEKKTLSLKIKRKTGTSTTRKLKSKKRLIINTEASIHKAKQKPVQQAQKPTQPQAKKIPPSEIKASQLDLLLQERYSAWRDNEPLQLNIEKQLYQLISREHLPYSKRVVQRVLSRHVRSEKYLQAVMVGNSRVSLENKVIGIISNKEKSYTEQAIKK